MDYTPVTITLRLRRGLKQETAVNKAAEILKKRQIFKLLPKFAYDPETGIARLT